MRPSAQSTVRPVQFVRHRRGRLTRLTRPTRRCHPMQAPIIQRGIYRRWTLRPTLRPRILEAQRQAMLPVPPIVKTGRPYRPH